MRNLFVSLAVFLAFSGCATKPLELRLLERGELADAYVVVVSTVSSQKVDDKALVVNEIQSKTGGARENKFKEMLSRYIDSGHIVGRAESPAFFLSLSRVLAQGVQDGVITPSHQTELIEKLTYILGKTSIQTPAILADAAIKAAYPNVGRYRAKIASSEFEKLEADPNADLKEYFLIYQFFLEPKDEGELQRVRSAMRAKVGQRLDQGSQPLTSLVSAEAIFSYIKLTGDRTMDARLLEALSKFRMSKIELTTGDLPTLFPAYAKEKLLSNVIRISVTSANDEFIVGEIIEELKKMNEWLEISDEAKRKLTIGRIRFQENRTNPSNMTEIVRDPNFVTLLMIPQNASVLFDYSTTEYSLQWSMGINDSQTKGTKTFSGQKAGRKVECRNMRYQNVYGGIGAIYSMPNDAVSNFCQSSSSVNFDQIRTQAISEIAVEINRAFLTDGEQI